MELSERNKLIIARVENFNYILRTAMFVLLGTLALGIFAEGNVHIWAVSATIIGATLYGMLAGNTALNDMAALREDMDEATKNTNYGVSVQSAPIPVFRVILLIVYLVIALTSEEKSASLFVVYPINNGLTPYGSLAIILLFNTLSFNK